MYIYIYIFIFICLWMDIRRVVLLDALTPKFVHWLSCRWPKQMTSATATSPAIRQSGFFFSNQGQSGCRVQGEGEGEGGGGGILVKLSIIRRSMSLGLGPGHRV